MNRRAFLEAPPVMDEPQPNNLDIWIGKIDVVCPGYRARHLKWCYCSWQHTFGDRYLGQNGHTLGLLLQLIYLCHRIDDWLKVCCWNTLYWTMANPVWHVKSSTPGLNGLTASHFPAFKLTTSRTLLD